MYKEQPQSEYLVPEGDLPPGTLPQPGRSPGRDVWTGSRAEAPEEMDAPPRRPRMIGVDAARGFALLGMIAVHTLPAINEVTDEPSLTWVLFSGKSAALFALLAGVTLALLTGGRTPHTGSRMWTSATSLVIRALLLTAIGLGINYLDPAVFNILPYYGLYFLLAIPFIRMGPGRLFLSAALTAVVGPVLLHLFNAGVDYTVLPLPTFHDLVFQPGSTFLSLMVGGTYPALTWMSYIFLGMGLGRLNLRRLTTQIRLLASGATLALAGAGISSFLLNGLGGFNQLIHSPGRWNYDDIIEIDTYGPADDQQLPVDTLWWLAVDGPHTNTPVSLMLSAGVAMATLGGFLLLSRVWEDILMPLIATGTMTLTLYSTHLIFITLADTEAQPFLAYLLQFGVAVLFATAWHQSIGRGPLERLVTDTSKQTAAALTWSLSADVDGRRHRLRD